MNISLKNIIFAKTKYTTNYKKVNDTSKKNYGLTDKKNQKIKIQLNNVFIPFGMELYNSHSILNIKLMPTKYNEHNNIVSSLLQFDSELTDVKNFTDTDIVNDIENKGYYPNIKKDCDDYLLRLHIYGSPEIYATRMQRKFPVAPSDIKGKLANVEIEISTLWVTDNNYGYVWTLKSVEIK
jgi:hypothetical protein